MPLIFKKAFYRFLELSIVRDKIKGENLGEASLTNLTLEAATNP